MTLDIQRKIYSWLRVRGNMSAIECAEFVGLKTIKEWGRIKYENRSIR